MHSKLSGLAIVSNILFRSTVVYLADCGWNYMVSSVITSYALSFSISLEADFCFVMKLNAALRFNAPTIIYVVGLDGFSYPVLTAL
jgi:hypothetical protein